MSSTRTSLLLAILTLLMAGVALLFFVQARRARSAATLAEQQILARDRIIIRQQQAAERAGRPLATNEATADPTAAYVDTARVQLPASAVFADELGTLTGEDLSALIKAGLPEDPEGFLKADLSKRLPTLAAAEPATLDDARILTPHLALASWHDSQHNGIAVLRYTVRGANKLDWQVLDWGE